MHRSQWHFPRSGMPINLKRYISEIKIFGTAPAQTALHMTCPVCSVAFDHTRAGSPGQSRLTQALEGSGQGSAGFPDISVISASRLTNQRLRGKQERRCKELAKGNLKANVGLERCAQIQRSNVNIRNRPAHAFSYVCFAKDILCEVYLSWPESSIARHLMWSLPCSLSFHL